MLSSWCSGLRVLRSVWYGSREVMSVATVARGFFLFSLAGLGEFKIAIRGMCMCTYMYLQGGCEQCCWPLMSPSPWPQLEVIRAELELVAWRGNNIYINSLP